MVSLRRYLLPMKRPRVIRVVLMLVLLSVSSAFAAELRAVISNALAESFREVIPEFERTSQIKVLSSFGGDDIPKRIEGGEPADVLIIWRTHLDKLGTEGFVVQASETDVVRSNIGWQFGPELRNLTSALWMRCAARF